MTFRLISKPRFGFFAAILMLTVLGSVQACSKSPGVGTTTPGKNNSLDGGGQIPKGSPAPTTAPSAYNGEPQAPIGPEVAVMNPVVPVVPEVDPPIIVPEPITGHPGDGKPNDPNQLILNGYYFIKTSGAKKCLGIPGDSKENDLQLQQITCDAYNRAMVWTVEYLPAEAAYRIDNYATLKAMQVMDQKSFSTAFVTQGDYFGLPSQLFTIEKRPDGDYAIRTKTNGLFVDVTAASLADKAPIQLWDKGEGVSSAWIFAPTK